MSSVDVPPSWYPDPADPSSYRWWDGSQWTDHTHARDSYYASYGGGAAGQASSTWSGHGRPAWQSAAASTPPPSFAQRNHRSLTALGVAALYIVVALTSHVVFLGVVPVAAAVRAFKRREPLAPLAAVAAVTAIVVAFTALSSH